MQAPGRIVERTTAVLKVKAQRVVNAPIEKVFSYLADFRRHPEWAADMASVERTSEGPVGAGSTFRYRSRHRYPYGTWGGSKLEVKDFVPNERLVYDDVHAERFGHALTVARNTIEVQPAHDGTRTTMSQKCVFPSLGAKLLSPLMLLLVMLGWPLWFWETTRKLRRIKSRLEAEE